MHVSAVQRTCVTLSGWVVTAIFEVVTVIVGPAGWVVSFGLDCIKDM
jgi:hypothetical protein